MISHFFGRRLARNEIVGKIMKRAKVETIGAADRNRLQRGRNSVVECQLPKLDVRGSNPLARSLESLSYPCDICGITVRIG